MPAEARKEMQAEARKRRQTKRLTWQRQQDDPVKYLAAV